MLKCHLTFMSRIKFPLSWVEHEKSFKTSRPAVFLIKIIPLYGKKNLGTTTWSCYIQIHVITRCVIKGLHFFICHWWLLILCKQCCAQWDASLWQTSCLITQEGQLNERNKRLNEPKPLTWALWFQWCFLGFLFPIYGQFEPQEHGWQDLHREPLCI